MRNRAEQRRPVAIHLFEDFDPPGVRGDGHELVVQFTHLGGCLLRRASAVGLVRYQATDHDCHREKDDVRDDITRVRDAQGVDR